MHVVLSRFIPKVAAHFDAEVVAVRQGLPHRFTFFSLLAGLLKDRKDWLLGLGLPGLYRFLGCVRFLQIIPRSRDFAESLRFASLVIATSSKADIEKMAIEGIWVGDLIYDSYLRKGHATLDFEDRGLLALVAEAHFLVNFWKRHLSANTAAVLVVDPVYLNAIVGRVAIAQGTKVFSVGSTEIYRLDTLHPFQGREYEHYGALLRQSALQDNEEVEQEGKRILASRLSGNHDQRLSYIPQNPYSARVVSLPELYPGNTKILVALHDFFDSPHVTGLGFFEDMYEWCKAISEFASTTDWNWYIKPHPLASDASIALTEELFVSSPGCMVVPKGVSPMSFARAGVRVVLTGWGTIATEAPAYGMFAIHSTTNHPFREFDFSITPTSREEYFSLLAEADRIDFHPNLKDLHAYHYLDHQQMVFSGFLRSFWERRWLEISAELDGAPGFLRILSSLSSEPDINVFDDLLERFLEGGTYRT